MGIEVGVYGLQLGPQNVRLFGFYFSIVSCYSVAYLLGVCDAGQMREKHPVIFIHVGKKKNKIK